MLVRGLTEAGFAILVPSVWSIIAAARVAGYVSAYWDHVEEVDRKLLASPAFAAYAHLLAPLTRERRYKFTQPYVKGRSYQKLSDKAKLVADRELKAVWRAARRAIPGEDFDLNHGNVLFH